MSFLQLHFCILCQWVNSLTLSTWIIIESSSSWLSLSSRQAISKACIKVGTCIGHHARELPIGDMVCFFLNGLQLQMSIIVEVIEQEIQVFSVILLHHLRLQLGINIGANLKLDFELLWLIRLSKGFLFLRPEVTMISLVTSSLEICFGWCFNLILIWVSRVITFILSKMWWSIVLLALLLRMLFQGWWCCGLRKPNTSPWKHRKLILLAITLCWVLKLSLLWFLYGIQLFQCFVGFLLSLLSLVKESCSIHCIPMLLACIEIILILTSRRHRYLFGLRMILLNLIFCITNIKLICIYFILILEHCLFFYLLINNVWVFIEWALSTGL